MTDLLEAGRDAYARRDWVTAREHFTAAQDQEPLAADDLSVLADCAWWLGLLDEALSALTTAYGMHLEDGHPRAAAMAALEIGYTLLLRGEEARGSGWLSRTGRLLADQPEGAEHGYLAYIDFEFAFGAADFGKALDCARRVRQFGERFADPNLVALGMAGQGRVLVKEGRVVEGLALLDEAMVAAVSDELNPGWAGNIYCGLMTACSELGDLRRAGEWTEATARWCERMPGAGPFMGICRVHRAELLEVQGAWDQAEQEVSRTAAELVHFDVEIVAEAHYRLGELRRRRGDLAAATAAFTKAHALGRDPQPGFALLRLAEGRVDEAAASIRSALAAREGDPLARAHHLPAAIEILLMAGHVDDARAASEELAHAAATYGTAVLHATAACGRGAVLLTGGAPERALVMLHRSLRTWQELRAPYEAARVRFLLARAYDMLGDPATATLERDAATAAFARLGARSADPGTAADARRVAREDGLSGREAQILDMVARGLTNQQIADELVLSIRTVERHLATVYRKLGLQGRSARAAAVRYALDEGRGSPTAST